MYWVFVYWVFVYWGQRIGVWITVIVVLSKIRKPQQSGVMLRCNVTNAHSLVPWRQAECYECCCISCLFYAVICHQAYVPSHECFAFVIPTPLSMKSNFNYILSTPGRAKRFISSQKCPEPTQPPVQWLLAALSAKVKRPGSEANHSLLKSEIKY